MNISNNINDFEPLSHSWKQTSFTGSFKKPCRIKNFESTNDVEELIKTFRQSKLFERPSTWNAHTDEWWKAASSGSSHELQRLLAKDPSLLSWKNPFDGWSAIHYVAKTGNLKCLDLLAKQPNADVNIQNKSGATPLHIAVINSQYLFVRSLIQCYHARTDIMDYSGRFPLTLLPIQLTNDLEDILSAGRLSSIRQKLDIVAPKHVISRHSIVSLAEEKLIKRSLKNSSYCSSAVVNLSPGDRILRSCLGGKENLQNIVRCLRHGKTVSIPSITPFKELHQFCIQPWKPSTVNLNSLGTKSGTFKAERLSKSMSIYSTISSKRKCANQSKFTSNTFPWHRSTSIESVAEFPHLSLLFSSSMSTPSLLKEEAVKSANGWFSLPQKTVKKIRKKPQSSYELSRNSFSGCSDVVGDDFQRNNTIGPKSTPILSKLMKSSSADFSTNGHKPSFVISKTQNPIK